MEKFLRKLNSISNFNLKLAAVAAVGGLLALIIASNQQVWFDEAYSIWITKGKSLAETTALTSVDAHPPLYYWLLNIWGNLGSWDFFWLRILSVIFFSLSIFVSGKMVAKFFNQKLALAAASLLVFSPFLLRYAFEIRMYSLASLITVGSTYLFILARKSNSKKLWLAYSLSVAAGMLTLYTLAMVFLSHFLISIYKNYQQKNWKIWREGWFKAYALAIGIYLLWMPSLIYQLKNSASSGIGEFIGGAQLKNMVDFIALYKPWGDVFWLISLAIILFWVKIFKLGLKDKTVKRNSDFKTLLATAFLPFIITIAISQPFILSKPFFVERYMAQFVILAHICLAVCFCLMIKKLSTRKAQIALLGFLLIFVAGIFNLAEVGNFNFQNYRQSNAGENMAKIESFCGDTPILMDDIYLFMELQVYNKKCDLRVFTKDNRNYGGGYAPINNFAKRVVGKKIKQIPRFFAITNKDKPADFASDFSSEKTIHNLPTFNNLSVYYFENSFDFVARL